VRELLIQLALSLLVLVGFANGAFTLTKMSKIFFVLFLVLSAFWVAIGFPQIFDLRESYPPLIDATLSYSQVYLINRGTKFLLFLTFFFLPRSTRTLRLRENEEGGFTMFH
jgi:hypothetical protein